MSTRYQCEFRQGLSSQNCFLHMIEKWRACIDDGQISGTILTDLSKAFGCINHDLLQNLPRIVLAMNLSFFSNLFDRLEAKN